VPQLLRGITAGLLMLGKGRAVELMDAIGEQVRMLIEPGAPKPDALRLERVAETCPARRALEAGFTFEERLVTTRAPGAAA